MQNPYGIPFNFGALPPESSSWDASHIVVVPVPYDLTTTYTSGTRNGPRAIVEASAHLELFDDELQKDISHIGIHTLEMVEQTTVGPKEMIDRVTGLVDQITGAGKLPVLLGGEHSITLGAVTSVLKKYPDCAVIQFDAHADLRESYQDSRYNHACVARRIHEVCPLTQVGIRSLSSGEHAFMADSDIATYYARDIQHDTAWVDDCIKGLPEHIYITFDLDALDPSIMPSVGTPEPGGLGWYESLAVLKKLAQNRRIVGFDIVELCPQAGNPAPDFLAAKLLYRLAGYATLK